MVTPSTSSNSTNPRKTIWALLGGILVAIVVTVLVTRPAAMTQSMTPISGLMTLKSMAAQSMPYEEAVASQKPTLIEFYADWCTTCQGMAGTVTALHEQYADSINFVMIDIDNPRWAQQVDRFGATGVPQFTLLNPQQEEVNTWVGKVPKPIFRTWFEQVLS